MRKCAICGMRPTIRGKRVLLRGHYNLTKTERKYPNLQWVRLPAGKAGLTIGTRVKACTECIKTLQKAKK